MFTRENLYFPRALPSGNMTISRVNKFSYLHYATEMNVLFHQDNVLVNWVLVSQKFFNFIVVCQMKYFGHLCLQNFYFGTSLELSLPLYDQSEITRVKSCEFRIREIRYSWEGNTIFLRGKYDVVEREIRCFNKCHVGLFRPIKFLYK